LVGEGKLFNVLQIPEYVWVDGAFEPVVVAWWVLGPELQVVLYQRKG